MLGSCSPSKGCQQVMADINSKTFWTEVATRYKGDGRVLFELYNEPHDVPWTTWQKGGTTGSGWEVVGMQQLYDAVRAAGADNLVIVGGLNWAFDLSGVATNRIAGYNIVYATHPYDAPRSKPGALECSVGVSHQDRSGHRDGVRRSGRNLRDRLQLRSSLPMRTCTRRAGRGGPGIRAAAPFPPSSLPGTERRRRSAWW